MGSFWSFPRDTRILMLGLDNAGKTTILYQLKLGESCTTVPTIGFNVESIKFNGVELLFWDVGGQSRLRQLWKHYYEGADAVIFVVDASDHERLQLVKHEITLLLEENNLKGIPFLIYCNKMDVHGSMTSAQLWEYLNLEKYIYGRDIRVQYAIAKSGEGLVEGLNWLSSLLIEKHKQEQVQSMKNFFHSLLSFKN